MTNYSKAGKPRGQRWDWKTRGSALLILPLLLGQVGVSLEGSGGQGAMVDFHSRKHPNIVLPPINQFVAHHKISIPTVAQPTEDCFCLKLFKKQIHQELF